MRKKHGEIIVIMPIPAPVPASLTTSLDGLNDLMDALKTDSLGRNNPELKRRADIINALRRIRDFFPQLSSWVMATNYKGDEKGLDLLFLTAKSLAEEAINAVQEDSAQQAETNGSPNTPIPVLQADNSREEEEKKQQEAQAAAVARRRRVMDPALLSRLKEIYGRLTTVAGQVQTIIVAQGGQAQQQSAVIPTVPYVSTGNPQGALMAQQTGVIPRPQPGSAVAQQADDGNDSSYKGIRPRLPTDITFTRD
jgi:hypothetical protein